MERVNVEVVRVIMCPRVGSVKEDPGLDPTVGSCEICHEPIWIARSSRDIIEAIEQVETHCNDCALITLIKMKLENPDEVVVIDASPTASPDFAARVRHALTEE